MTHDQMVTAIETRIGNPSTDGFFTAAQKSDMVNEGLQVVSAECDWPWLQATATISVTQGTVAYAVPADYSHTKLLYIEDYDPMEYLGQFDIATERVQGQSQPIHFTVWDEDIVFSPEPNASYTVIHKYIKQEPAITGASSPIMPSVFHYSIVAKAVELAHLRQGYLARAEAAATEYREWLSRMYNYKRRVTQPVKRRVRPGGGF